MVQADATKAKLGKGSARDATLKLSKFFLMSFLCRLLISVVVETFSFAAFVCVSSRAVRVFSQGCWPAVVARNLLSSLPS
jgi:hypothetical protein